MVDQTTECRDNEGGTEQPGLQGVTPEVFLPSGAGGRGARGGSDNYKHCDHSTGRCKSLSRRVAGQVMLRKNHLNHTVLYNCKQKSILILTVTY